MDRLTSSCRFPPLLQLPTAAQLSYSHQMIVIITKLVAVMMIINHWAHLVSKAYSKDWFRIRRSQKLFHLGHRCGTSLSINVNVKRWCTKKVKDQDINNFKDYWQKNQKWTFDIQFGYIWPGRERSTWGSPGPLLRKKASCSSGLSWLFHGTTCGGWWSIYCTSECTSCGGGSFQKQYKKWLRNWYFDYLDTCIANSMAMSLDISRLRTCKVINKDADTFEWEYEAMQKTSTVL